MVISAYSCIFNPRMLFSKQIIKPSPLDVSYSCIYHHGLKLKFFLSLNSFIGIKGSKTSENDRTANRIFCRIGRTSCALFISIAPQFLQKIVLSFFFLNRIVLAK